MKKSQNHEIEFETNNYGFLDNSSEDVTEEMCLEYLTEILTDMYFKEVGKTKTKDDQDLSDSSVC